MHKILWVQLHDSNKLNCPRKLLLDHGSRLVGGYHYFDDPAWQTKMETKAAWQSYQRTQHKDHIKSGDIKHLDFMYFNKETTDDMTGLISEAMLRDPDLNVFLLIREGYQSFCGVLDWLQERYPDRHVSAYLFTNNWHAWRGDKTATKSAVEYCWNHVDLRLVRPSAVPGMRQTWKRFQEATGYKAYVIRKLSSWEDIEKQLEIVQTILETKKGAKHD